jgi:4'-phosphopantetheinyl transferase
MDRTANAVECCSRIHLSGDIVDLWLFRLHPGPHDRELLSPCELQRAHRFVFEQHRQRFIAGRAQLRRILATYLALPPEALMFGYGSSGKPALAGPLSFNLSHSGDVAALAVALFDVGIDIECIRPVEDNLAEQVFSAREVTALRSLPQAQWTEAFFACWTRKEAYVKALGDGLRLPLDRFSVSLKPSEPARLLYAAGDPTESSLWEFHHFTLAPDLVGAIAARQRAWHVRWHTCQS